MSTINSVYLFFNTPKRQKLFTKKLELFKEEENLKVDRCRSDEKKTKTPLSNSLGRTL